MLNNNLFFSEVGSIEDLIKYLVELFKGLVYDAIQIWKYDIVPGIKKLIHEIFGFEV